MCFYFDWNMWLKLKLYSSQSTENGHYLMREYESQLNFLNFCDICQRNWTIFGNTSDESLSEKCWQVFTARAVRFWHLYLDVVFWDDGSLRQICRRDYTLAQLVVTRPLGRQEALYSATHGSLYGADVSHHLPELVRLQGASVIRALPPLVQSYVSLYHLETSNELYVTARWPCSVGQHEMMPYKQGWQIQGGAIKQ